MTARRYPIEPLCTAMGMSPRAALTGLGVSGSTMQQYRSQGVTERVADRLATKAGLITYTVWPEILQDAIEDERARERRRNADRQRQRYWSDPAYREAKKAASQAYRDTARRAKRLADARYREANRERLAEKQRRRDRARAAEAPATQRDIKDGTDTRPQANSQGCGASNPQGAGVTVKVNSPNEEAA